MSAIAQEDLVARIADAPQCVSFTHPGAFVRALRRAYQGETHAPARAALLQLLVSRRQCTGTRVETVSPTAGFTQSVAPWMT